MLLINAIYFKANWKTKFNERDTKPMKFQVTNDIQVDYDHGMNMRGDLFHADMADSGFNAQVLELPYENENFRMLLILPNEGINIGELNLVFTQFLTLIIIPDVKHKNHQNIARQKRPRLKQKNTPLQCNFCI